MIITDREVAIAAGSASISFVGGLWAGIFSVPDAALDVPMTTVGDGLRAAYHPVPNHSLALSGLVLLVGLWVVWRALLDTPDDSPDDADDPDLDLTDPQEAGDD